MNYTDPILLMTFWSLCICQANYSSKAEDAEIQAFAQLGRLRRHGREFERSKETCPIGRTPVHLK